VRTIWVLVGVAAVGAGLIYYNFGTLSPCGMLRAHVRQRDGLAAVLPDSIVDAFLAAQYGALTPSRCIAILANNQRPPPTKAAQASAPRTTRQTPNSAQQQTSPPVVQNPIQWALEVTTRAAEECRAKRLSGKLPSRVASAQCANPLMISAFNQIHYRYMDLIELLAAKRLEFAAKIDRGELTEQQAQIETQRVYDSIDQIEKQRDGNGK
jgi:hypothetical protein